MTGEALAAAKAEAAVQRRFDHPCLLPLLASETVDATAAQGGAAQHGDDGDGVPTQHVLLLFPAYTVRAAARAQHAATASRTSLPLARLHVCSPRHAAPQDGTLQDVCDAVLAGEQRLPVVAVLRIILQVAEGLAAMHAASPPFAHRDVKPANVLLSARAAHWSCCACEAGAEKLRTCRTSQRWQGLLSAEPPGGPAPPGAWGVRAVLTDFGSARYAHAAADAASVGGAAARAAARAAVEAASVECTAPYRPPELFDCPDASAIDERVDVWALGCTLCVLRPPCMGAYSVTCLLTPPTSPPLCRYAAMYGSSPFEYALAGAGGGSIALAVMSGRLRFPKENAFPAAMHDCVRWMLTASPAARPRMTEVVARLRELLHEPPWLPRPAPAPAPATPRSPEWDAFAPGAQEAMAGAAEATAEAAEAEEAAEAAQVAPLEAPEEAVAQLDARAESEDDADADVARAAAAPADRGAYQSF